MTQFIRVMPFVPNCMTHTAFIQHEKHLKGDNFHLQGDLKNYFNSIAELIDYYKSNPILKLKPTRHELEVITGQRYDGQLGGFLNEPG